MTKHKYAHDAAGVPALPLTEKVNALRECLQRGQWEDSLGHLFDLLHHVAPQTEAEIKDLPSRTVQLAYGTDAYFMLLWQRHGQRPSEVPADPEPPTDARDLLPGRRGPVTVLLADGSRLESGWCEADDPEALVSGDYLSLRDREGRQILYLEATDLADYFMVEDQGCLVSRIRWWLGTVVNLMAGLSFPEASCDALLAVDQAAANPRRHQERPDER